MQKCMSLVQMGGALLWGLCTAGSCPDIPLQGDQTPPLRHMCGCVLTVFGANYPEQAGTVFGIVAFTWGNCFLYAIAAVTGKQSICSLQHIKPLLFQVVHGHLAAVVLLHLQSEHGGTAALMGNVLIMQQYVGMMKFVDAGPGRGTSPPVVRFALRGSFFVSVSYSLLSMRTLCTDTGVGQESIGAFVLALLDSIMAPRYPLAVLIIPTLILRVTCAAVAMGSNACAQ